MEIRFRKSFLRDLKKIRDERILKQLDAAIDLAESARSIDEIPGMRKLSGSTNAYRIRVGVYRIGIVLIDNTLHFARG